MNIDITKLAREAGFSPDMAKAWFESFEHFATLHRAAVVQELIEGVGEPQKTIVVSAFGANKIAVHPLEPLFTAEQVAGAVAKSQQDRQTLNQCLDADLERIESLEARNAKLREALETTVAALTTERAIYYQYDATEIAPEYIEDAIKTGQAALKEVGQ